MKNFVLSAVFCLETIGLTSKKPGFSEKKSTVDSLAFADVEGHDLTIASPFQHLSTSFLVKSFFSKRKKVAVSTTKSERVDTSYVLE